VAAVAAVLTVKALEQQVSVAVAVAGAGQKSL
jgi:hypothetical protein